jgi:hypothetical protein
MMRRLAAALLLLFLAVVAVNWPELPMNARLADLVFLPLLAAVLAVPALGPPRRSWHRADTAVVLYLLGAVPAIVISSDQQQSAIEFAREIYVTGIYVVFAIAAQRGFASTIATGLAICGALWSAVGVLLAVSHLLFGMSWAPIGEVMQLPYLGDTLRLRGLTFTPAMFACLLTATVPFAILSCTPRARAWCAAAMTMGMAALLTFSHAIAGFAVAALIAMWPSLPTTRVLRRAAIAGVVVIVLGFNFAATAAIRSISTGGSSYADRSQYYYGVDQRQLRLGGVTVDYNVMSYARIKQVAWQAFTEHPIAGVGLDRFHTATLRAFSEGRLTSTYREIDPHSTLLGRFAECGVIGGATLLFLWVVWGQMAVQLARRDRIGLAAAAALAGLAICSINADVMNFRFVWVIAGLMRGLQSAAAPNASTPLNDHGHAPR